MARITSYYFPNDILDFPANEEGSTKWPTAFHLPLPPSVSVILLGVEPKSLVTDGGCYQRYVGVNWVLGYAIHRRRRLATVLPNPRFISKHIFTFNFPVYSIN